MPDHDYYGTNNIFFQQKSFVKDRKVMNKTLMRPISSLLLGSGVLAGNPPRYKKVPKRSAALAQK